MNTKNFSEAISEVDDKYYIETANYQPKQKKQIWVKWGAIAACLCFVVVSAFMFRNWSRSNHEITFNSGDTLVFAKSDSVDSEQFEVKRSDVDVCALTSSEIKLLFNDLPASGVAYFDKHSGKFVAFEGKINDISLDITAPGEFFADTIIDGKETISEIQGTAVSAGYFLTDKNSKGERTIIYYASFKLGQYEFYVEHAGIESNSDSLKTELANTIQTLISNGELDISSIYFKPTE